MKSIKTYSGEIIFVDDDDFEYLSKFKWQTSKTNSNNKYALRHAIIDGKRTKVYMHREIMKFPNGLVDHIDMNGLNCQKSNLRIVDKSLNAANSRIIGAVKYKGVCKHQKGFRAQFKHKGIRITKLCKTPEEAALYYNELALKYRPNHSNLNIICQ